MSNRAFVIISGLPASGKSTLARALAERLSLPLIEKDEILESLYDSLGIGDHAWRHRLSRASDDVLFSLAARTQGAVLDNWWHHETAPARLREPRGVLRLRSRCRRRALPGTHPSPWSLGPAAHPRAGG